MVQVRIRAAGGSSAPSVQAMQACINVVVNAVDEDTGRSLSDIFWELPDKKELPDYYDIIQHPMALEIVQTRVNNKEYALFSDFLKDMAQIFHNAKTYNRRSSVVYEDAATLERILLRQLGELRDRRQIEAKDAQLPVLGPPPPASDVEDSNDDDSGQDDDDEEDEDEDEDEPSQRRRRRTRTRKAKSITPLVEEDEDDDARARRLKREDYRRKRGRPPRVDTPNEARIKNVIKGVRKEKDRSGRLLIGPFEKLPDIKLYPDYFRDIRNPIALDGIKKKVKRRQFPTIDAFLSDMDLMFENAKRYNEDGSDLHHDASRLQYVAYELAEIERRKSDAVFMNFGPQDARESSFKQARFPLESIPHKGEQYRVGDWVHIANPNDVNKPTVAQIFRTWKTGDGQLWVNACWYYRPEQTVHSNQKTFLENEVVKSGQYRDHHIDEVIEHCFVMFFTRYARGRPKEAGNSMVYVCEARYNEVEKTFNKIKTWKSCIPDEVRSQDYEMYLFERPRPLRRVASPLLHLLPPDAKEDDPIPEAVPGLEGAPPKVGAVYRRPPDPNEPPITTKEPSPVALQIPQNQPAMYNRSGSAGASQGGPGAGAGGAPAGGYENLTMSQMYKQAHAGGNTPHATSPSPMPMPMPSAMQNMMVNNTIQPPPQQQSSPGQRGFFSAPAPQTTFTFPSMIPVPEETAKYFARDGKGDMLWFSVPPLDPISVADDGLVLGHTAEYVTYRHAAHERKRKREEMAKAGTDTTVKKHPLDAGEADARNVLQGALQLLHRQIQVPL